jgi:hypothetical protein
MRNLLLLTVLTFLLVVAARPGVAEVVEIPLVTRAGVEPWDDHVVAFDTGMPLPDVTGVSLRIVGEGGGVPYAHCMDFRYSGTEAGSLVVALLGEVPGPVLAETGYDFGDGERQPFGLTLDFPVADFSPLETGRGHLWFEEPAGMISTPDGHFCPLGNGCVISEATLVVEFGDLVAVEATTWSTLKAIYR